MDLLVRPSPFRGAKGDIAILEATLVLRQAGIITLLLAAMTLTAIARNQDEPTAQTLLLIGRYEEAAERFTADLEKEPAAAIGLARCHTATGKREEAQRTLEAAAARFDQSADVQAELALAAFERGDHEPAGKHAAAALALDKDCVLARWVEAELLRTSGKLDEAQRAYAWFIGYHNRARKLDDPWKLVWIGRAAAQHARWTRNSNQFRRLVSDLFPSASRIEPKFWPARLEAARLFLEKYNEPDAASELDRALAINPSAAELHAAKAAMALDRFDLATAKTAIERALEINPQLLWAHQLQADLLFADVKPAEAIDVLEQARQLNPRDEATLGRLLAAYLVVDGKSEGKLSVRGQQIMNDVSQRNPRCGEVFLAAGEALDRMRRYPLAAEYFRAAHERMPQLISTRGQLGLVLMRLGEEAEAAKLLEESFAIDPFNLRIKNMLEVLDHLKNYAVLETDHFILKFDRGQDELLARYAAKYLEDEVYPELTKEFGFAPEGKTLIEIFSRGDNTSGHSWFSARMVGLPFIGTVGACAGKMVAITSPGELEKKYNWAHVLKHEYTHVLNLQQTNFNIPHWLTEGLAVQQEDEPRPRDWTALLARRAKAGELFTLDDITLGFVRPKSSEDWTLAYCQSELYVEFMLATYGDNATQKLLTAYADRLSTPQAIERCFGVKQPEFEAAYRAFLDKALAESPAAAAPAKPTLAELQRQVEEKPDDADIAAQLALAWLDRDDKPQARRWAIAAQKLKANHPLAAYVLARLQLSIGDAEAAMKLLEGALDREAPGEELLALLASLKLQAGDAAAAEELYQLGDKHFPASDRWIKGLARIYLQSNDAAKLAPVLVRWIELEPENLTLHKKLARLALDRSDFADAEARATIALQHDVQDAESHALLAAALAGKENRPEAVTEYQTAIQLESRQPEWHAQVAALLIQLQRREEARKAVAALRELDPDHPELAELDKSLSP
jgi:Tfp pilus assembly protein PilF